MLQEFKNRVENGFENHAYFVYDNYKKIIPAIALTIILLVLNLYNIKIDVSTEGFLYKDDPNRVAYTNFKKEFGKDEKIIIAIENSNIYSSQFLNTLAKLHNELERDVPYLKDIQSLINARKTTGDSDSLIVGELFENSPISKDDIDKAREYIDNSTLFEDLLVSHDGKFTTIMITPQTYISTNSSQESDEFEDEFDSTIKQSSQEYLGNTETSQMIDSIKKILSKYQSDDMQIHIVGMSMFTDTLIDELLSSMLMFVGLLIVSIVTLLTLFFRRRVGVMLAMMTVGMSILSTISLMSVFEVPLTSMSAILPSFILSIGIGDSVHLLGIFFKEFDKSTDKRASIAYALKHSGLAIVLTTFTTAISLLSFAFSDIAPSAHLGIFAAIGAIIAMFLTLFLIPAMLSKFDIKPNNSHINTHNRLDEFLKSIAIFSTKNAKPILAVSSLIIICTIYLASNLRYKHDPLEWVPQDNEFRVSTGVIDKAMRGSMSLEVIVDTGVENGIYNPNLLNALDRAKKRIESIKSDRYYVGKVISITSMLKEINRALNQNNNTSYTIPQNRDLIAQEFLLFENSGSDDLSEIVDSRFTKTRITIKMPWVDAVSYIPFLNKLQSILDDELSSYATNQITGTIPMMVRTVVASLNSTVDSYIISYGFITILMILLLGDIKLGLISMIPNITPVIVGLSAMLVFGMNLDMFTILIGAIAIGLAVDDTIHFMHNFKRYYHKSNDVDKSIILTLTSTGRAMFMTTVILSLGFFIYMFSNMSNIFNFGAITGIVIIVALLADFILLPALLKVTVKSR